MKNKKFYKPVVIVSLAIISLFNSAGVMTDIGGYIKMDKNSKYTTINHTINCYQTLHATLLNDEKIFIAGPMRQHNKFSIEIYDTKTQKSSQLKNPSFINNLSIASQFAGSASVQLDNGNILFLFDTHSLDLKIAEEKFGDIFSVIYDVKNNNFIKETKISALKSEHLVNIIKLENGNVMVSTSRDMYLYNPDTNTYQHILNYPKNIIVNQANKVSGNKIYLCGKNVKHFVDPKTQKNKFKYYGRTVSIFDIKTNKIENIYSDDDNEFSVYDTLVLDNGNVVYIGKNKKGKNYIERNGCIQIFNNKNKIFQKLGHTIHERSMQLQMLEIKDNKVLFISNNMKENGEGYFNSELKHNSCEILDLNTNKFHLTEVCIPKVKYRSTNILLPNNKVAIIGGGYPTAKIKELSEIITIDLNKENK